MAHIEPPKLSADDNQAGAQAESNNDPDTAAAFYEKSVKAGSRDSFPYERLMVIYRKQKKYKEELRVINKGIKVFKDQHEKQTMQSVSYKKNKKKVDDLSNIFMKQAGLKDKKGNHTYYPEPVNKWVKRKELVEKRLGK